MSRRREAVIVFNISKNNLQIAKNTVDVWCHDCKCFVKLKPAQISGKIFHVTPESWIPHREQMH